MSRPRAPPRRATRCGALSVGAFDATTLLPESYSSEGPTDDGRLKPDISAPTNVLITPGDPESEAITSCGGTSCATPHVARRGGAALAAGRGRRRRGQRRAARARPARRAGARHGRPGPDTVFGAGGCGSTSPRRCMGAPAPGARTRSCAAPSRSRCRSPTTGTLGLVQPHGRRALRSSRRSRRAASCRRPGRRRASPPARTLLELTASDQTRQRRHLPRHPPRRQRRRRASLRDPGSARARAKVRISASVLDPGSGLAGRPRIAFGDGAHANGFHLAHVYKRPGRYIVTDRARPTARATRRRCSASCAYVRFRARSGGPDQG